MENRAGSGRFVTRDVENTMLLSQGLDRISSAESLDALTVYQARATLEPLFSHLAAQNASGEGIKAAERILIGMERSIQRGSLGAPQDRAFHIAVAEMIANPILAEIERTLINLGREPMKSSLARPGRPQTALEEHRAILQSIRDKDPERAAQAMRKHLKACEKEAVLSLYDSVPTGE